MTDHSTDEIRFERRGQAGVVILDRPKALNALTLSMVEAMQRQLDDWAGDPAIAHVVLTSASEKAFCAGGDIRRIHDMGKAGDPHLTDFFHDEYILDRTIHRYPKPFTSLIDGICMGGGVGLSAHGMLRIGSEKILFAMPEVAIGFFPDVGGTHMLSRMPGETGAYAAMTGARLKVADCLHVGFLTHHVPSARMVDLLAALCETDEPAPVAAAFHSDPGEAPIAALRSAIDRLFAGDDAAAIVARLEAESGADAAWAQATAAGMRGKSPTSMAIALCQVRIGGSLSFEECMRIEFRIVSRILEEHDFYEGVRSVLIDRDNAPDWRPATFEAIAPGAIEAHFTKVPAGGDLVFAAG
ncbi:enoyl-CoA hydratase/isomerase family protein [Pinisolibacter sp.]|uniref:enoyl-CoA hydratase/isomerase family protein n=1 Tax=Pinisolibacter sp. TaxID=2172024 RepID=UPI002FDCF6DC